MITASVLADSIGADAPRLTTFELCYPRFIHAEVMTHRVFSRNASSSRAIPTSKMLAAIEREPAKPVDWRMNESGMQGFTVATPDIAAQAEAIWNEAMLDAVRHARRLDATGVHKQFVNRLTEPYQHIRVVLTATDLDNWNGLRDHTDAEPHIQILARAMKWAIDASTPKPLTKWDWHLPYITPEDEIAVLGLPLVKAMEQLCRISAARCARVSYKTFDGKPSTVEADLALFHKLVGGNPIHASPTEHQATPDFWLARGDRWLEPQLHGNLNGWKQFRKFLPNENLQGPVPSAALAA